MIYLTRRERFNAAHRLYNQEWTDEKNFETFGKCANPNWHGHNYELFVTIKGEINEQMGYLVNLKTLSKVIREHVTDKLDHRNMNLEVDFMKGRIVSTENLAREIWNILDPKIRELGASMHCIKVVETENNYVEYFGN